MKNKCPYCNQKNTLTLKKYVLDETESLALESYDLNTNLAVIDHMLPHGYKLINKTPIIQCYSCGQTSDFSEGIEKVLEEVKEKNPSHFNLVH